MDLNYLLLRHQVSLMRAGVAACPEARHAHFGLAQGYADRITRLRHGLGLTTRLTPVAR